MVVRLRFVDGGVAGGLSWLGTAIGDNPYLDAAAIVCVEDWRARG